MNCKSWVPLLLIATSILPWTSFATAQTDTRAYPLPTNCAMPDDRLGWWWQQNIAEPSTAFFTFDQADKVKVYLDEASCRVEALKLENGKGNHAYDNDLTSDYQAKMDLANATLNGIADNDTKADAAQNVVEATSMHLQILQAILGSAPTEARKGLLNAITKSQNGMLHAAENAARHQPSGTITIPHVSCAIATVTVGSESTAVTCTTNTITLVATGKPPSREPKHITTVTHPAAVTASDTSTLAVQIPRQAIQSLIGKVQSLGLDRIQTDSLVVKLNHALDNLNSGKARVACNELNAFIGEVSSLTASGVLDSEVGTALISQAQFIINAIKT